MLTANEVFEKADQCDDHPLKIDKALLVDMETVLAMGKCGCNEYNTEYETCNSYCDSTSFAVAKLQNGQYLVVSEWGDSTGHGCRCDGTASIHDTLEQAKALGLTEEERQALAGEDRKEEDEEVRDKDCDHDVY